MLKRVKAFIYRVIFGSSIDYRGIIKTQDETIKMLGEAIERLKISLSVAESALRYSESPCGHSSRYAYSPDGKGKKILCMQCRAEKAEKARMGKFPTEEDLDWLMNAFQREHPNPDIWIRQHVEDAGARAIVKVIVSVWEAGRDHPNPDPCKTCARHPCEHGCQKERDYVRGKKS